MLLEYCGDESTPVLIVPLDPLSEFPEEADAPEVPETFLFRLNDTFESSTSEDV